jgi:hypothetical protein
MEKHPAVLNKELVVGVIVLFIGVGIQSAIAKVSENYPSDLGYDPDLKIISIDVESCPLRQPGRIIIKIKNIGSDSNPKADYLSFTGSRCGITIFGLFGCDGQKFETFHIPQVWKHNETKEFVVFEDYPYYPPGIYWITVHIGFYKDSNTKNNFFWRYFLIFMDNIFPKTIFR